MKLNQLLSPFRIIIFSYFVLILIGSFLLYLPFAHKPGVDLAFSEAFFTAASAISVTGLSVVSTTETFSVFGIIILSIII